MRQVRVPEIMDDPSLDSAEHAKALVGLRRLNSVSGAINSMWREVRSASQSLEPATPIHVLDVATGGGDIPLAIALRAQQTGLNLKVSGCDISATAIDVARKKAQSAGVDVEFFVADALRDELPRTDIVINSLFLHHLHPPDVIRLFKSIKAAARTKLIINDLERSYFAYGAVWVACRLLSTSHVVHFDGPVSVRASYTSAELYELATTAGLNNVRIARQFPCRLLLTSAPS